VLRQVEAATIGVKNGETENGIRINLFNDGNDYLANAKTNQTNH
jgi:hypothetical protein